ncbi:MAG: isoamylase early set domain-containing protein [Natronospirillum sp.]
MSIKKRYLKSKPVCKCTFELPRAEANGAEAIFLVGDFNAWDIEATPMKKLKNGTFKAELDLPSGRAYAFRYRRADGQWENDSQADHYMPVPELGVDNSVVQL